MQNTLLYIWFALTIISIAIVWFSLYRFKKQFRKEEKRKVFSISEKVSEKLEPTLDIKVQMGKTISMEGNR